MHAVTSRWGGLEGTSDQGLKESVPLPLFSLPPPSVCPTRGGLDNDRFAGCLLSSPVINQLTSNS